MKPALSVNRASCVGNATHLESHPTPDDPSRAIGRVYPRARANTQALPPKGTIMITPAAEDPALPVVRDEVISREPIAGSRKVYVAGTLHPDIRVPMREISQTPTKSHLPEWQGRNQPLDHRLRHLRPLHRSRRRHRRAPRAAAAAHRLDPCDARRRPRAVQPHLQVRPAAPRRPWAGPSAFRAPA